MIKILFTWQCFIILYFIFWNYYARHPFKFEETNNPLIIAAYFYLPLAVYFFINHFFRKISHVFSVSLSIFGIVALPIIYYLSSTAINAKLTVADEFRYLYSLAVPIAAASLLCLLKSIPAYLRLIFRKPQYFMFSFFLLLGLAYSFTVEYRLYGQLNGYEKFFCSYQDTKQKTGPILRIIGSYGEGSGFYINSNTVVTNRHVVEGEDYPKAVFANGKFLTPLKVELSTYYDIAFLTMEDSSPFDYSISIKPATLTPGEEVLSFGYALGSDIKGDPTILPLRFEEERQMPQDTTEYLQFSSSIVGGMSGGPVMDKCGHFVGINTMSTSGTSLIISPKTLQTAITSAKEEPKKIDLYPGITPEESVFAYYYLLKARDTKGCYNLLSSSYKVNSSYEEWTARFPNIINVEVVLVKEIKPNLVYVLFGMDEWIDGEQVLKAYEGTWTTVKEGDVYLLARSYILEIENEYDMQGPDYFLNSEVKE